MKDGQGKGTIQVAVCPLRLGFDIVVLMPTKYLQSRILDVHTIAVTNFALILLAQDIAELVIAPGNRGAADSRTGTAKVSLNCGRVTFGQVAIGRGHVCNVCKHRFLGQPAANPGE